MVESRDRLAFFHDLNLNIMNTHKLKSFAPKIRVQLMEAVSRKLDVVLRGETADLMAATTQVASLRRQAERDRAGLVDRVAYTWFNRFAALRFIDARGWHPFHMRVLMPASAEENQPELLKEARRGALPEELRPYVDADKLNDLLDGRIAPSTPGGDPQGEVYRLLVLGACRYYHALMPFLFESIDDESELLLPDDILTAASVVHGFREAIADTDCEEVEVLGWLYQFYISERKDEVMKRKKAVPTGDVPAVTQLFTPHWIVKYLVENSLGRLWLQSHPDSGLADKMAYYVPGDGEQETGGELKVSSPEEIKIMDPACGSGHMLTYAFDLLVEIYTEAGYAPTEIPTLILEHNLHGAEICPRAGVLAAFALVMKAREVDRRFFQRVSRIERWKGPRIQVLEPVRLPPESQRAVRLLALQPVAERLRTENENLTDSPLWKDYTRLYKKKHGKAPHDNIFDRLSRALTELIQPETLSALLEENSTPPQKKQKIFDVFEEPEDLQRWLYHQLRATEIWAGEKMAEIANWDLYGALIQPDDAFVKLLQRRKQDLNPQDAAELPEYKQLSKVLEQLQFLECQYHVVVANPPYMGGKGMNTELARYAKEQYPDSKSDLFAMFMERNRDLSMPRGHFGMITMQSWMFLSSYENLRKKLLQSCTLTTMAHLGARGFDSIGGEVVSTTAFVQTNCCNPEYKGAYFRLVDGMSEAEKEKMYLDAVEAARNAGK